MKPLCCRSLVKSPRIEAESLSDVARSVDSVAGVPDAIAANAAVISGADAGADGPWSRMGGDGVAKAAGDGMTTGTVNENCI